MSIESTRETMQRYFNSEHGDVSMMASDVVFTIMASGQEHHTPEGVMGMLNYFYHVAFDATAATRTMLFGESNAMVEGDFVGKHIRIAGIPATGRHARAAVRIMTWRMIRSSGDVSLRCRRSCSSGLPAG
jgi:hypothetical protein